MHIIMPIPANAPQSDFTHHEHGQPSHTHTYRNHDGAPLFYVFRYEWQDNDGHRQKTFSPLSLWKNDSGSLVWQHKAPPAPRPLYGLEHLASNPNARVLMVEGEKTCDAARKLFPDLVCLTSMGGSNGIKNADLNPLAGRDIVIWPDNDSAGHKYANDFAKLAYAASATSCAIVMLPGELPEKWDLSDTMPDGLTHEWLVEAVINARPINQNFQQPESELEIICMRDVKMEPMNWLWPDRIPHGKITVIAGNPGLGKSQITAFLAAVTTTGGIWPNGEGTVAQGDVIILSAEDDAADTIKPRLEAAGADTSRCHVLEAVKVHHNGKSTVRTFNLVDDADKLAKALERLGNISMVVIDPISAYLGKTNSHNNADLRGVLAPFALIAAKYNVAIIAVTHFNKSNGQEPIGRVIGSIGLVAAARAAYAIIKDDKDSAIRYFVPLKNNNGNDWDGFAYRIETVLLPGDIKTSKICWQPNLVNAQTILSAAPESKPTATTAAGEFLLELLSGGKRLSASDIISQAEGAGYGASAIRNAKQKLGIKHKKLGMNDGWEWFLPTEDAEHSEDINHTRVTPSQALLKQHEDFTEDAIPESMQSSSPSMPSQPSYEAVTH